jgi:hypothetical protein
MKRACNIINPLASTKTAVDTLGFAIYQKFQRPAVGGKYSGGSFLGISKAYLATRPRIRADTATDIRCHFFLNNEVRQNT